MKLKTKKHSVITKVAWGWDEIEPVLVAFTAARLPLMLKGLHGNAKTTVGKLLGYVFGDGTFRYYDCSKANLISMCGFPDAEKMRAGEQAFVPNNRSLIGSDKHPVRVILLDEITRTPKDAANQLLEVIEDKTIYGIPTGHEVLIATANPESYKGATKLDSALLDRFVACLPIPDFKDVSSDDVEAMIQINIEQELNPKYVKTVGLELKDLVDKVATKYQEFVADPDIQARIGSYAANLVAMSKAKWGDNPDAPYISGREASSQLWRAIIALAAYYVVALQREERAAFVDAARDAIKYCWVTKHGMTDAHSRIVETVHREMKFLLTATGKGPAGKVQIAFAKSMTPQAKVSFWEQYSADVVKHCDASMMTEMMNSTVEAIDEYKPTSKAQKDNREKDVLAWQAKLYAIAKRTPEFNATVDNLEGRLVCQLIHGMNTAGVTIADAPFNSALTGDVIDSSNITDLLVELAGGGNQNIPF